ncbi:MAG: hypothetical protein IKV86_04135, partial [Clostridia bacterium]|nr:hypothetical protein [Clostridia bacterium]
AAVELRLGFNSAGTNTVVYADDFYLAPLRMEGTVTGPETIVKNISETYTAAVTNQLGTAIGLSGEYAPDITLSLKENYQGVTLENNVLTVNDAATTDEVVLVLNASTTLPIAPITVEKTVKIRDNYFENGGFENGISNMKGAAAITSWVNTVEKGDGTTVSPYEGSYALKLEKTAAGGYASTTAIPVVSNTVYIAKEMLFKKSGTGNTGGKTSVNLDSVKDSSGNKVTLATYETLTNFTTTDTWQQHEMVFNSGAAVELRLGFNSAGTNTVVYADDFYLAPLRMEGSNIGEEKVVYGETATYSAVITNQLGTTTGVSNDYVTVSYSLKEAVEGVTIDAQTGVLTVAKTAEANNVTVVANAVHSLSGVKAIVTEKTVEFIPFALEVSDFAATENEETVLVTANLNGSASVAVIYAMYQGEQLKDCHYATLTSEETAPLSHSFSKPEGGYTVKIFILDATDNVTPLAYSKCSD